MTTTCPSAPRQVRGLRGATLRRLAGNKCPRIYQTHDLRPNRCDARPLPAVWQGEAMTKIEVKATPEWLAEQEVRFDEDNGLVMLGTNGLRVSVVDKNCHDLGVHAGVPLLRRWLVEQIEAGYHAGAEAGRTEGQECIAGRVGAARGDALTAHANELRAALGVTDPWDGCLATVRDLVTKDKARPAPTDAAAEDTAIDGLVGEAARLDSKNDRGTTLHHRDGDIAIFLEDTRSVYVRGWLRPWLLAAWARGVAYGQVDISTGESRCAAQLANALGHPGETLPTWEEALAMVTRDRQPTPGDFFGMAALEQVAAERAVDAAAVAPSEEALATAREEGRRAGIEEATTSLNEYLGRRLVRLANATRTAEEARKTAAQRNAEVAQLTVETETLREALGVLFDTKETP